MNEAGEERRLTTILATDVVGFSRLMAVDEVGTLTSLKAIRRELIEPKTAEHHGRVVKLIGDGSLMEFGSVVGAVRFAVDVQRAMALRNTDVPEDRRITYRIGINIGDIIVEGDDIYGDGVNVAARLESLAEPGGICVARTVVSHVQGKVDLHFEDLGEQKLKNIPKPIQAFKVLLHTPVVEHAILANPTPAMNQVLWWPFMAGGLALLVISAGIALWQRPWEPREEPASIEAMAFPLPKKPSIAVLPFDNLSGDTEQDPFANGMTDDLITDLSKITGLFVIARNSTFVYKNKPVEIRQVAEDLGVRYVMEGSVRRAGDTVRINAQLIDATTGGHIWADRFDGPVDDIFDIQDKFVRQIVNALQVTLLPEDAEQIGQGQTDQVSAREAFQKGWELYLRFTPEDNVKALEHVEAAVELDPEYGRAYALLALIYLNIDNWSWYGSVGLGTSWMSYRFNMNKVEAYLDLAKRYPTALAYVAGSRYAIANRDDHALALDEAREAIALDPNEPEAHIAMAWALITTNEPAVGLKFVETAFRLNPRPPAHYFLALGFAYFALGELDKAAEIFKAGSDLYPDALDLAGPLASTYALLGRREDAHQALLRWKGEETQRGLEALIDKYYFPYRWPSDDRKVYDRYWDGLYAATLPPETTVSDLIDTARNGDVIERLLAMQSLGRLRKVAAEAVPALITGLGDEEQSIRKEAAIALGKIGPAAKEAIPALEELKDQIIVGTYAREALKSIKGE